MEGTTAATCEVEATDVVRVVLQFLKENGLTNAMLALQDESQVALNTVDNLDTFVHDVQQGHWESVMTTVATLKLPAGLLSDLYEQVVLELLEMRELDTARQILRTAAPMAAMKAQQPERHRKLESLAGRPYFEALEAYGAGTSKERRRAALADSLKAHVTVVPPSRLLALLGQSLKWQQHQGMLPKGSKFDLFRGAAAQRVIEPEAAISAPGPVIKFGKSSHPECACFSPDGQYLVSGSVDGFIEVWDFDKGRLRKDLEYQAKDELMMHDVPVLCLSFSRDSELLAAGDQDGAIKARPQPPTAAPTPTPTLTPTPTPSRSRCGGWARVSACAASPRRTRRASRARASRATARKSSRAPSTKWCACTASSRARSSTRC